MATRRIRVPGNRPAPLGRTPRPIAERVEVPRRSRNSICTDLAPRPLADELPIAQQIRSDAARLVNRLFTSVRFGEVLEAAEAESMAVRMIESLARNRDALVSLVRVRHKDHYTFEHSVNVAVLAGAFGQELGLNAGELCELTLGALLHDVGKAYTPDAILKKPGRLTAKEYEAVKRHVSDGVDILSAAGGVPEGAIRTVREHHERCDGTGYPAGLQGDGISLHGQVVGICDVYDAITADRCYRPGQEPIQVLGRLLSWGGAKFETVLVHRFIQCVGMYPVGTLVRLDSDRLAAVVRSGSEGLLFPVVRAFYDIETRRYIDPVTVELSENPESDRIAGCEPPEYWGVSVTRILETG